MDKMLRQLSKYPNGTPLIVEWKNGGIVAGNIDTIYDADNGLNANDKNYDVFYVCILIITDFLVHSAETKSFAIGDLMELSIQNQPMKITLKSGEVIWNQDTGK